ncbi:MAG TPA: biotin/lipoyl-containing protein, partial [Solirubrobacterales bacterium]|nr:biotin/lipoyl-containing protein [Solirubrobacterales bacterium]
MPRLSDSMEEGTILTWMKQVGDEVAVGDELVEIETDKANMAYESDVAGTLTQILAEEGDTLAIGSPIAVVGGEGDGNGAAPAAESAPERTSPTDTPAGVSSSSAGDSPPEHPQEGITPSPAPSAGVSVGERVKASPVARRIAKDTGVDLGALTGSGPGGRIVKADVESAAAVPAASTPQQAAVGADGAATETAK